MNIALVHDYLTQYGGAERVLSALHEMFPDAPILTSLHTPDHLPEAMRAWDIRTSPLARIPGARHTHRVWTPIYPTIFSDLGRSIPDDTDVVIADSSAWAHHAFPAAGVPLIVYCHSPARFLYGDGAYLDAARIGPLRSVANPVFAALRQSDQRAAQRVTTYVANSEAVRQRIHRIYARDAEVVYPPVDVERFRPASPVVPEEWFLVVSRLVPHKWIDRAIRAAMIANVPLKIIGSGRSRRELQSMAGPGIELMGEQSDGIVVEYMQRCRALILPGIEDFGMTAVEAQAAGRPVIAARGGGALETVLDGVTGWHFEPDDVGHLAGLLQREDIWNSEDIQANASRFNRAIFEGKMREIVERTVFQYGP